MPSSSANRQLLDAQRRIDSVGEAAAAPQKADGCTSRSPFSCLKSLSKLAKKEGLTSLAFPRLATGVGGLDWADVKLIVEKRLGDLDIPVYVYVEYHAGQQGSERGL